MSIHHNPWTRATASMFSALLLLAVVLPSPSHAIHLSRRQDGPPRVVGLPIERITVDKKTAEHSKRRRRGVVEGILHNEEVLYYLNASVGTPPQALRLHIDTGSSDLWVNSPGSQLCLLDSKPCEPGGSYDVEKSSTSEFIGHSFNITYVDGSGASGDYVRDTFTIGTQAVLDLQFGIGYTSSSVQGVLGIGYEVTEAQVIEHLQKPYPNLPAKMVADGLINSNAYSLWLNDLKSQTGQILFGGVDTEKYDGELSTLPIQTNSNRYELLQITMTGVSMGPHVLGKDMAIAARLDTGSTLTYLPNDMVDTILNLTTATYDTSNGMAYTPCSLADQTNLDLVYSFSGVEIRVPVRELVLGLLTDDGQPAHFVDGRTACLLGIAPAVNNRLIILGDTFLRSAYVVYDLDNNEISLAQTRFRSTKSNILEIQKDAVPGAVRVTNPVPAIEGFIASRPSNLNGLGDEGAAPRLIQAHAATAALVGCMLSLWIALV